ncbi:MAG TPA: hypothetical protein VGB26_05205 [Nitrospiria bacterium]
MVVAFFALLNSTIAVPLNWQSLLKGKGFWLEPITSKAPPIPLEQLALPTDSPKMIIKKMGCYVCHKIPFFPDSRESEYGPILITGSTSNLIIASPGYQEQVHNGKAKATTAKEYIKESILNPSAFILPGYEDPKNPELSSMYRFYGERFTEGGLEVLVDYLLTLTAEDAMNDGLIIGHQ